MLQRRVVAATMASDPRKAFTGTSPYPGDTGFTGIVLPWSGAGSGSWRTRMLVRLCSVAIPAGQIGRLRSLGQLLTIAACVPAALGPDERRADGGDPCAHPALLLERPVVTPLWTFPDGNVSWHLKVFRPTAKQSDKAANTGVPNYDNDAWGTEASVLSETFPPVAYIPVMGGMPPGEDVSGFGMWHDIRYDWMGTPIEDIAQPEVRGPCILCMFATVYQTDPATRLRPDVAPGVEQMVVDSGLVPEDLFMLAYQSSARYYRIGGRMIVDVRCKEHEVCPQEPQRRDSKPRKHDTGGVPATASTAPAAMASPSNTAAASTKRAAGRTTR